MILTKKAVLMAVKNWVKINLFLLARKVGQMILYPGPRNELSNLIYLRLVYIKVISYECIYLPYLQQKHAHVFDT